VVGLRRRSLLIVQVLTGLPRASWEKGRLEKGD
jgi:hypothetical protein